MSAVEQEVVNQIEELDIDGLLAQLGFGDMPETFENSLQKKNESSLCMTVPSGLWQKNGHSLDDCGDVDGLFWDDLGIMVCSVAGNVNAMRMDELGVIIIDAGGSNE
jgi:hypothetical protein